MKALCHLDHVSGRQRPEVDAVDSVQVVQTGDQRAKRDAAGELVAAVRDDEHDPLVAQPMGEVGDQVERRPVGPVHVLQDKDRRAVATEPVEQPEQGAEETRLPGRARVGRPPG